ncbi:MAG: glycerol-3-phosphate 1-O-acyltransferase PlsY [Acutalibacteraceae bacterium]|nr:glycerol-3-phosphate 1-O-acyltransferase PlsY [Acutalibacteraceae bacterium]
MTTLWFAAAIVFAYAVGSISFAVIFSKIFAHKDVRDFGSGSAGMTNVIRAIGILPGLLTFVFDALKGFVACYAAKSWFFPLAFSQDSEWCIYGAYICGAICMLGHMFPLFFSFKGGKGVATSVGIFAVCCPYAIIAGLIVFILCFIISRIISLSSLIATVTVFVGVLLWHNDSVMLWPQLLLTAFMCALVFIKHKDNIIRLSRGEEKKLKAKK